MAQQVNSTTVQTSTGTKIVIVQTEHVATVVVKEHDKSPTVSHIRSK